MRARPGESSAPAAASAHLHLTRPALTLGTPARSKLKAALAPARRAAFPGRPSRQAQLPADLADLTAQQLLGALAPVLPALRRHLDAGAPAGWRAGRRGRLLLQARILPRTANLPPALLCRPQPAT